MRAASSARHVSSCGWSSAIVCWGSAGSSVVLAFRPPPRWGRVGVGVPGSIRVGVPGSTRVGMTGWRFSAMAERTPSGLSSTSLFQNRNTRYPSPSRNRVRLASDSDEGSCCPPSISTINLAAWQAKSAMNPPIGTWRRNRQSSVCRDRSICQRRLSASVMSRRRVRARSPAPALGAFFTMDRSSASPPPRPSPIEGEGV